MLLFLFAVVVISFSEKKKREFLLVAVLFITAAVLFKTDVLVELGIVFFFLKGNDVLNRTSGATSPTLSRPNSVVFQGF